MKITKSVLTAAVATGLGIAASGLSAATISTGVADWKFVDYSGLPGSNTDPSAGSLFNLTNAAEGSSAASITGNDAWVAPAAVGATSGLSWISALGGPTPSTGPNNGRAAGLYGLYTYELKLDAPPLVAGTYQISGKFTSDNLVDSFTINGQQILPSFVGPTEGSYAFVYTLPVGVGNTPITLRARIYNESTTAGVISSIPGTQFPGGFGSFGAYPTGPNAPGDTDNPTGFILDGQATLVPTPTASLAGISLLAGLGAVGYVKRRRNNADIG